MKIQKIFIKNLNSLAGEHTIDFTIKPLSEASLFAITGPTGAGKSTILDAICLAMYDQSPRISKATKSSLEETGALISRGATESEAMVEYEQTGNLYRSQWMIKFARTGALSERKMELSMFMPTSKNWIIITSKFSEVPIRNGEITKLDYGQFTRSILLAQGEFAKLLSASKEERYNLMEKITGDDTYRRIGKKVHEVTRDLEKEIDSAMAEVKGMTFLTVEEINDINVSIKSLSDEIIANEDNSKKLLNLIQVKQQVQLKQKDLKSALNSLSEWEIKQRDFQPKLRRLEQFEKARPVFTNLETYRLQKSNLKTLEQKVVNISDALVNLDAEISSRLEHWSKKLSLNLNKDNFQKDFTKELNTINDEQQKLELAKNAFTSAEAEYKKVIEELKEKQGALQKTLDEIILKEGEVKMLTKEAKPFQSLISEINSYDKWDLTNINLRKEADRLTKETKQQIIEDPKQASDFLSGQHKEILSQIKAINALGNPTEIKAKLSNLVERRILLRNANDGLLDTEKLLTEELSLKKSNKKIGLELLNFQEQFKEIAFQKENFTKQKDQNAKKLLLASAVLDLEVLRAELADGDACPLCGSTDHPGVEPIQYKELEEKKNKLEASIQEIEKEEKRLTRVIADSIATQKANVQRIDQISGQIKEISEDKISPITKSESCLLKEIDIEFTNAKLNSIGIERIRLEGIEAELNSLNSLELKKQLVSGQIHKVNQWINDWTNLSQEVSPLNLISSPITLNAYLEALSKKKKAYTSLEKNLSKCQNDLSVAKASKEAQLHSVNDVNLRSENRKSTLEKIATELDKLKLVADGMPSIENPSKVLQNEGTLISTMINNFSNQTKLSHSLAKEVKTASKEVQNREGELTTAIKSIGLDNIIQLEEAALSVLEEQELSEERLSLVTNLTKFNTKKKILSKEIVSLEEKDDPSIELDKAINDSEKMGEALGLANQQKGVYMGQLSQNEILEKTYSLKLKDIDGKKLKAKPFQMLNDLIGDSQGKRFNEYAQELTLRRLLMASNANLATINPRYELDMPSTTEDGNSLYVIDRFMGDGRRAADVTLSGGELFMVSLALALGLSDMAAGKAELGNLFIDEGFGSLDQETLDGAIGILEELQSKRGRVIGIISHVSELKERITTQLRVEKRAGGVSAILPV